MTPQLAEVLKSLNLEKRKDALRTGRPICDLCFTVCGRMEPMAPPMDQN